MNCQPHVWKPVTFHAGTPAFQCEVCSGWSHHGDCIEDGVCSCGLDDFIKWESEIKGSRR